MQLNLEKYQAMIDPILHTSKVEFNIRNRIRIPTTDEMNAIK